MVEVPSESAEEPLVLLDNPVRGIIGQFTHNPQLLG